MDPHSSAIKGGLAPRAARSIQPALPYFKAFMQMVQRPWTPSDPEGNVVITVAENSLSAELFLERLSQTVPCPIRSLKYDNMKGSERLRKAVTRMMSRTGWSGLKAGPLDPDCLVLGCGAGTIIDQTFFLLCSAGDCVLVNTPFYPAFSNDLAVRNGCAIHPYELDVSSDIPALLDSLERAFQSAPSRVGCLLLTNPHNPLGTVYTEEQLAAMARWALGKRIHIVVDEIYALSCWGEGPAFVSLLKALEHPLCAGLDPQMVKDYTHVIYGMAKDWAASGLRMGFLYTRNEEMLTAFNNLSYFGGVGGPLQDQIAQVLEDDAFVDGYLAENNRRLRRSYDALTERLDHYGIPHHHSSAAMFCWIDLSAALGANPTWEGEAELWQELVDAGVLVTPGSTTQHVKPGFFRACFAWVPTEALPVAADRIAALLKKRGVQLKA